MSLSISNAAEAGLLPEAAVKMLKRRVAAVGGLVLVLAAGALGASLFTFAAGDASFNSATDAPVRNLLGRPGAHLADLAMQLLGIAGGLPVPAFLIWGWRLVRGRPVSALVLRFLLLVTAMVLFAIAASVVPTPASWPLAARMGGAIGMVLLGRTAVLVPSLGSGLEVWLVAAVTAMAGAIAFTFSLGIDWRGWGILGQRGLQRVLTAGRGVMQFRLPVIQFPRPFRTIEVVEEERPHVAEGLAAARREREERREPQLVAPKPAKPKAGRKEMQQRQGELALATTTGYRGPALDLLTAPPPSPRGPAVNRDGLEQNAKMLSQVLEDFGVHGQIVKVRPGPVVTLYELEPAPGTKTSRVIGLADDLARSMSALSVRVAVVPGRNVIGIELPNIERETVFLREQLASEAFERNPGKLMLALGKDIGGGPVVVDLTRMPHLLIAGTTGSGKSVAVNTMILSLLYRLPPEVCRFIMIDPKMLELSVYEGIPHLLAPVVTEPGKAVVALKWTVREMEDRYRAMSQLGVRNIAGYNARLAEAVKKGEVLSRKVQTGFDPETGKPVFENQVLASDPLPYIVVVVDEMADLMLVAGKDIEAAVQRLAQMARAAGIHLIMATQRPSVDVITGTIKANFPTRVSFQVTSKIDSRTILGEQGAEQLLGQGDMLYMAGGGRIMRVHGPFVADEEVEQVVSYLKTQGDPAYVDAVTEEEEEAGEFGTSEEGSGDDLYDQALAVVVREGKASTSFVQRHLQIGYNRAARLIERMEAEGVVSRADRVGRREVLMGGGERGD